MEIFDYIKSSDIIGVKTWIENKSTKMGVIRDEKGNTPLIHALRKRKTDIASLFIEKTLYIFETNNELESTLHAAAYYNQHSAVIGLIKKGVNVNQVDSGGRLALHCAVLSNNYKITCILIENGSNINAVTKLHNSALIISLSNVNAFNITKKLLNEGAALLNMKRCTRNVFRMHSDVFEYHLKLQVFILVCPDIGLLSFSLLLKFSKTFKLSFKV